MKLVDAIRISINNADQPLPSASEFDGFWCLPKLNFNSFSLLGLSWRNMENDNETLLHESTSRPNRP